MNAFQFFEAKGKAVFDIAGGIGVMCKFQVVVEAVLVCAQSQGMMPGQALGFPGGVPFQVGAGGHEVLHLHLLKFPHPKDELPGNDFVAKGFAGLGNPKGDFHATALLDIEEVHKNALGGFGPQVQGSAFAGYGAHFGGEHQVKLPNIGPVAGSADGADDFQVQNQLLQGLEIGVFEGLAQSLLGIVDLGLDAGHVGVGFFELNFVKAFTPFGAAFVNLLLDFGFLLGDGFFDQNIGAVAFFGIFVINQRVVEGVHVAGGFPNGGVHKNRGVQADNVIVELDHGPPPVFAQSVLEDDPVLSIIVDRRQPVVDFAGLKHKAILFGVADQVFELFFGGHRLVGYGAMRPYMRGKGMVSRTWGNLQTQATRRSRPRPKPEWGTEP